MNEKRLACLFAICQRRSGIGRLRPAVFAVCVYVCVCVCVRACVRVCVCVFVC